MEERAEKIAQLFDKYEIFLSADMYQEIFAQIREAVEEALKEFEGLNRGLWQIKMAQAYEDAAKIAEHYQERRNSHRFLALHISRQIRARAKELQ